MFWESPCVFYDLIVCYLFYFLKNWNLVCKAFYTEVEKLNKLSVNIQAFGAFQNGTTENLIKLYEELGNGEQKEGMDSNYKAKANEAVATIKELESIYNNAAQYKNHKPVFINRAVNRDLKTSNLEADNNINDGAKLLEVQ